MSHSIESAPVRPVGRALAASMATALSLLLAGAAWAQTPPAAAPAAPAAKPAAKPAPKPAAKPAAPAAAPHQAQQAAPPPGPGAGQQEMPQLIYSTWTKVCQKAPDPNAKQVCATEKEGRLENGMPVIVALVIEQEGEQNKLLRITVPLGMQIAPGTRVIIDQGQPSQAPYVVCLPNGCISDYSITADTVNLLKKGQALNVQAINLAAQPLTLPLPLGGEFGKAYDGPPSDPKVVEEQQKKLQEELQRKADDARKKLESQQPAPGARPGG